MRTSSPVMSGIRASSRSSNAARRVVAGQQGHFGNHELPALLAHGVRLAPILVGSCLYATVEELVRVQWLHDPGRDGALNLVADQPGERDRRICRACENLVALLPPADIAETVGTEQPTT